MSEQLPQPKGQEQSGELLQKNELDAIREKLNKELESNAEKAKNSVGDTEQLARKVEQYAISGKEMNHGDRADTKRHPVLVNKQLKDMAYLRAMTRVRKHLSLPSKAFSKVVHSKAVERPSEIIGNTVARPSGMLGGAFVAAVGSSILLWITKHYGYEYNYLAVVLLFVIGLTLGLAVEILWKTVKLKKH